MRADIFDTIALFRAGFRDVLGPGSEPPTINLATREDGMRFLSAVRQSNRWDAVVGSPDLGLPVGDCMEVQIFGVRVRWPAVRWTLPDGKTVQG